MPAWDRVYRNRGSLWGGAIPKIPDLPAGSRVLDLGCGNGRTLSAMGGRGWEVVAADISGHAVRIASTTGSCLPDTEFLVADGRALPFRNAVFDAVFAWHILGHGVERDREMMAQELARILAREGRVFFRGFSRADMRFGKGTEIEPGTFRRGDGIITHYFSEKEAEDLFSRFTPELLTTEEWSIRIRGTGYPRSEITGTFRKK